MRNNEREQSIVIQRKPAVKEQMGARVLKWLTHLDGLDEKHILPKEFIEDLCHIIILENNDQVLVEWLIQDGTRLSACPNKTVVDYAQILHGDDNTGRCLRRRQTLMAQALRARLRLAADRTANDALTSFFAIFKDSGPLRGFAFPTAASFVVLERHLHSPECAPCDEKLYEDYHSDRIALIPQLGYRQRTGSLRALYHPTSPDPWPTVDYIARELEEADIYSRRKSNVNHMGSMLLAAYLPRLQGAPAKAQ